MIDDIDFDPYEMDDDGSDFNDDIVSDDDMHDYEPQTRFGFNLKQRMKLERMKLRMQDKANRRANAVKKIAAKKGTKLTLTLSFCLLVLKGMVELHQDKLDKMQEKDALKEAKLDGIPPKVAKQIVTSNKKQLAGTVANIQKYILGKVVQVNG